MTGGDLESSCGVYHQLLDLSGRRGRTVIKKRSRTYGVTLIPGTLFMIKSAATKAFDFPTSDSLLISIAIHR